MFSRKSNGLILGESRVPKPFLSEGVAVDDNAMAKRVAQVAALNERWIACPHCDAIWARPRLQEGERARCGRCHSVILTNKHRSAERTIALMISALLVYSVAISFPFLRMESAGLWNQISVIDAVATLWRNGLPVLAISCAGFILLFPLGRAVLLLGIGVQYLRPRSSGRPQGLSFRLAQTLEPWSMAEIFMIGVIVSLVKVGKLATIEVGISFYAMFALMILLTLGSSSLCKDTIWQEVRHQP